MPRAFVAFGGNVGDARSTIANAITAFCDGDQVVLLVRSSDYRTPPWGVTDQGDFINACIAVETRLTPRGLLDRAHEVERAFGRDRQRETRWGPRSIDIDIIDYDGMALDDPMLTLPHPRALERAFVLVPLAEIAPDATIGGRSLREALGRLDRDAIKNLPPVDPAPSS